MRTAMFGGSFNPIHNGHIDIAAEVREKYSLDRVLFMVANDPPHKKIADGVKADVRYEMTRLALENHGDLEPCDLELKRQGKSYTVDTLEILHEMYPEDRIFCIVGADMLLGIDTWYNAPELLKRAEFIAVGRPDSGGEAAMNEKVKALEADYGAKVYISGIVGPDISSTAIRERVEDWRPITDLVPLKVAEYIYQNGLYFPEDTEKIRQRLKADLKPTRYAHTMRVMIKSIELADKYGVDRKKAALAGLLHDCAKLTPEKQYELANEYGLDVSSMAQPIIHGPLGAVRARRVFGITDNEVLSAISCHTTCKSRMTALDKIVYLADKIEQGRIYDGVEDIRRETDEDLDRGMVCCIEHAIDHVEREKKGKITPETYIALNEIKKSLEGNND